MRNNLNDPPRGDLNTRNSAGGMMLAAIVAAIVLLGLFMWAPWNDSRSATTNTGTTVGSSTARPGAPTTPTSPTTPASPTNR